MRGVAERLLLPFARLCAALLVVAVGSVLGFLVLHGYAVLKPSLLFGRTPPLEALLLQSRVFDGIFPAVIGTLSLVVLSVCWAVPIGVASGIYLSEYAGKSTRKLLNLVFDILAGLPSIVIGLFGFSLTVLLNRTFGGRLQPCLLFSSIALAFLVLPYIIRTTQTALEGLPLSLRITALAVGAGRLQNLVHVLLPQAFSGIISGVVLAIGRCAEDTAVIMLTGAVASAGIPHSLFSRYEALPYYIYYISSQYSDRQELATGYGAAIVLLGICLTLFFLAFVLKRRYSRFSLYGAAL